MALCIVNDSAPAPAALWSAARDLAPGAPVMVMIHGYRFSPASPCHDPHRHILALDPAAGARRAVGWPRALGLTETGPEGLGIAFGWEARGSLRRAYATAGAAGASLAPLIARLACTTGRPVGLIGHSLGARVALSAMTRVDPGAIGQVILLAGAEFRDQAAAAVASPAGRCARIVNITTRENDMFDLGFELALRAGRGRALGHGLAVARRNWTDLQLDDPASGAALAQLGYPVARATRRACHWSPYLRDGVFALYRALLWGRLAPDALAAALPAGQAPRWSRFWPPQTASRRCDEPAPASARPAGEAAALASG